MGILSVGRISKSVGRRFTGVLECGRLMSSSVINSDEKGDALPWLMRRPAKLKGSDQMVYRLYGVEEKKKQVFEEIAGELQPKSSSRIVGSSHGWLAWFNYSNGSLFLTNPCSGRHIELPSLPTLPDSDNWASRMIISDGDVDECRALMIYGPYQSLAFCVPGRSDKWLPIDDGPNNLEALSRKYENMVYSRKRKVFFCIKQVMYNKETDSKKSSDGLYTTTTALESWDLRGPHSPPSPRITWSLGPNVQSLDFDADHYRWRDDASTEEEEEEEEALLKKYSYLHFKYLVMDDASDQLFLVVRHVIPRWGRDGAIVRSIYHGHYVGFDCSYPHKTIDFDVYKIELENNRVSHVNAASLGGLALFLGTNNPVSVRPRPGSGLKPNSIYFTDLTEHVSWYYSGHDTGVFDYENKTFSCLPHSKSFKSMKPKKRSIQELLSTPLPLWYTPY